MQRYKRYLSCGMNIEARKLVSKFLVCKNTDLEDCFVPCKYKKQIRQIFSFYSQKCNNDIRIIRANRKGYLIGFIINNIYYFISETTLIQVRIVSKKKETNL